MTHLDLQDSKAIRRPVRPSGQVQQAQVMLVAAGLAAFLIVAVAAAVLTTIL